ncbi:MAG: UDP-N-acetylmuramoyl-tripeptide--D-alanyl-D-alanine ligase [Phycisphaerales bacterium]|nr:UDP-N-acetylmuramoyl-tripeptide--D-alanyl-D-alanine ligase [Phycisphaerales bacterium]
MDLMTFWRLDNLKSITGGTWLARPAGPEASAQGLTTDSRQSSTGRAFLALKGERTDGHLYLKQAADQGAVLLIVDRDGPILQGLPPATPVLKVADTSAALLRLGAAYRRTLEGTKVIAVGGSNGKTTTTRLIEAVLSQRLRGTASAKSFNNAVGVPVTILGARRGDQFLVCEVGTNAPGEIAQLAPVIEPDIAVIVSIGREHLEGLSSLDGVVREETSLLGSMHPGGSVIINADCPQLVDAVEAMASAGGAASIVRFGTSPRADLRVTAIEPSTSGVRFRINDRQWLSVPLLGRHNAINAAAAVAVARRLGLDWPDIEAGLAAVKGPDMRMQRRIVGGIEFINDAYNANPESALAAIQTFKEALAGADPAGAGPQRRVMVFGDMLELGGAAPDAHREIGDAIVASGCFDLAVFVGPLAMFAAERVGRAWPGDRVRIVETYDQAAGAVGPLLKRGDLVLLKGSRRVALERVVKALEAEGPA